MELYATIRKKSCYYSSQQEFNKNVPVAFKVKLDFKNDPFWPVQGGPGGRYTLWDVDLWIKRAGRLVKVPMHERP